jgi:hypothetical protein
MPLYMYQAAYTAESWAAQVKNLEGSVRSRSREGAAGAYDATSLKPD